MDARLSRCIPLGAIALFSSAGLARAQTITQITPLTGHNTCDVVSLSADGNVATGRSWTEGDWPHRHAYRWTRSTGTVDLGVPLASTYSDPAGISADGSLIIGMLERPFTWTAAGGMQLVWGGYPTAVSSNGAVIVGYDATNHAVRWNASGVAVRLAPTPPDYYSKAFAANANGSVIAGTWSDGQDRTLRWTAATGMVSLQGMLASNPVPTAVNADGSVIVGYGSISGLGGPNLAFRCTNEAGAASLGFLPGGDRSEAHALDAGGNVVVGMATVPVFVPPIYWSQSPRAFIWTPQAGMVNLHDYLVAHGVDLGDWVLGEARGISANGRTVTGTGSLGAFVVTLPGCGSADFNHDGDGGTDADIEAFFACLAGHCCAACDSADFNDDGDSGTDADIESFFRVLAGGAC